MADTLELNGQEGMWDIIASTHYVVLWTSAGAAVPGYEAADLVRPTKIVDGVYRVTVEVDAGDYLVALYKDGQTEPVLPTRHYQCTNAGETSGPRTAHELAAISSVGTGARTVTFTVTDSVSGDPIEGVRIRLYRAGDTDRIGPTESDGTLALYCDDATWSYVATNSLYISSTGTIVVNGDEAEPVSMVQRSALSAPSDPSLCRLATYIKRGDGTAVENGILTASLKTNNSAIDSTFVTTQSVKAFSDSDGYVELELLRQDQFTDGPGTYVVIVKDNEGKNFSAVELAMPNQESAYLEDLIGS